MAVIVWLASVVAFVPADPVANAGAGPLRVGTAQVLFDAPGDPARYGPNEAITANGVISFIPDCDKRAARTTGINDVFQPWADVYIVPAGQGFLGNQLNDVSGVPNVVFGGLGGGFIFQTFGYTAPGGTIQAGTYDVVVDECQDRFVDIEDTVFPSAISVTVPIGTKPAVVGDGTKARARTLAGNAREAYLAWDAILRAVSEKKVRGNISLSFASDLSIGLFQVLAGSALPDPRPVARTAIFQMHKAQAGLAADPPDPDFQAHAALISTAVPPATSDEPLEVAMVDAARATAVDAALLQALVTAVERQQGAAEVGNGDWMAAHARDAIELIELVQSRTTATSDAMRDVVDAWTPNAVIYQRYAERWAGRADDYLSSPNWAVPDQRDGQNRGLTAEQVHAEMVALLEFEEIRATFKTYLTFPDLVNDYADDLDAQMTDLDSLKADLEDVIAAVAAEGRDAPRPTADAGGPYVTTTGTAVIVDASASSGPAPLTTLEWDLDLDGNFDDATGTTAELVPAVSGDTVVALRVTDDTNRSDVAFAPVTVTQGDLSPLIDSFTPDPAVVEVGPGDPVALGVTVSDPEAQPLDVEWFKDGVPVMSGTAYAGVAPASPGTSLIEAVVTDPGGNAAAQQFVVTAFGPDTDGDLWRVPGDCEDGDPLVNGSRLEVTNNGKDDDCNPTTPDASDRPTVWAPTPVFELGPRSPFQEGDRPTLSFTWSHPLRYSGEEFPYEIDWGDGTTEAGVLVGATPEETALVLPHTFRRQGSVSPVACITEPGGKAGCNPRPPTPMEVLPSEPVIHPADITTWANEYVGEGDPLGTAGGSWRTSSDGSIAQSDSNSNFPYLLMSDFELPDQSRIGFQLGSVSPYDDDAMGVAFGLQPGETTTSGADWVAFTLNPGFAPPSCTPSPSLHTAETTRLMRYRGWGTYDEYWYGHTFDIPSASSDKCKDDQGGEVLADVVLPEALGRGTSGFYRWRVPGSAVDPLYSRPDLYDVLVEYSAEHISVWLDDILVLEADAHPDDPFPLGRVALLSQSQELVEGVGQVPTPHFEVDEGSVESFETQVADGGITDVVSATISFGDGTPAAETALAEVRPGLWDAAAEHAYADNGEYELEVCAEDATDGLTHCEPMGARVANVPPTVDAGPDVVSGPSFVLDGASYADPGTADTHTATVDWDDGSPVEPVAVEGFEGAGLLTGGSHSYLDAGTYSVEVCVTDDDGDTGCDTLEVEVVVANWAPQALVVDDVTGVEGTEVALGAGFTDANPQDTHTVTVDWGDGSGPETVEIQDGGLFGSGQGRHVYGDDGTYEVTVRACDGNEACDEAAAPIEITNAVPEVGEVSVSDSEPRARDLTAVATFTDLGVDDTHTATVDWGDGSPPSPATVEGDDTGGGTVTATHGYTTADTFTVEVCVTDDDGATGCASAQAATDVPSPPLDVSAIGGDGDAVVRWDTPLDDGGSAILDYEIETTPGGATQTTGGPVVEDLVEGLTNGSDHTFRVRARNAVGSGPWSLPSNTARPRAGCLGDAFVDVTALHPFCPEIQWMADSGVSTGFPDDTYRPVRAITRQAMAAFTYRVSNPNTTAPPCVTAPFPDVAITHAFCGEIAWMKAEGISTGFLDGGFHPADPVARQAMAAFLYRLTGSPRGDDPICGRDEFTDVTTSHPFCGEIDWLVDNGIAAGFPDGSYRPTDPVTRQAMAAFIFRYDVLTDSLTEG